MRFVGTAGFEIRFRCWPQRYSLTAASLLLRPSSCCKPGLLARAASLGCKKDDPPDYGLQM